MKKKILIIDDEEGLTSMLKLNLEATDKYEVKVINQPEEAMSAALSFMPDLILLDIIMPNIEGSDIAMAFGENSHLQDIPIVFLTATVRKSEVDSQGGRIGGHPFVAKPSTLKELMETIDENMYS